MAKRMTELGLWAQLAIQASFCCVFRTAPPLTTTEKDLNFGLGVLERAFSETEGSMPLYGRDELSEGCGLWRPDCS